MTIARHIVIDGLHDIGFDGLVETAALLTSELAANAVRHARTPFTVSVDWDGQRARIQVTDESREPPRLCSGPVHEPGGLGLTLVSRMATRWGYDPRPSHGKVVWFELDI